MPRWRSAAAATSPGWRRHFTSGFRRTTPRLVHGASTRTPSPAPAHRGASASTGPSTDSTIVTPSRAAASPTRARRAGCGSSARIRPRLPISWARCVVFVPGAAQASTMLSPGAGSSRRATSIEASSCTTQAPSANARQRPGAPPPSTTRPSGASAAGRTSRPSSARSRSATASRLACNVLARTASGGRSFSARISASASAWP